MTADSGPTLYDRLGVKPTAPFSELRRAYRLKALELHPDVSSDSSGAMATLNEAWAILSNPATRACYDAGLVVFRKDADPVDAVEWDPGSLPEDFEPNATTQMVARLVMGTLFLVGCALVALFLYAFTRSGSV
ncbi:MAG TPA: J domain-containing protein [Aeromicrobium sp.]|nr:J domain-containing protein [Aeromicrobium sp.]